MMNCREATRLMSEARDRRLNLMEKASLKVHLWMCTGCRNFDGQMDSLRDLMRLYAHEDDTVDSGKPDDRSSGVEK